MAPPSPSPPPSRPSFRQIARDIKNIANIPRYLRQKRAAEDAAAQAEYTQLRRDAAAGPLPIGDLYRLASLEGVYLSPRGRSAKYLDDDLGDGLVARFHRFDGWYFFLGRNGHFFRSEHALGRSGVVLVPEAEVDMELKGTAWPYRQLCA
ncbi:hypothetical protein F4779DRAFT_642458 [Xylariaceae sp. FL0662B]|nr:hypothetical protein F4779DRAFT_642458 [Xylariaceae sp. FL0662B]